MIGLLFFGVIGLWGLISLYLGIKLPKWFKFKSGWSFLFVPLLFFAPVIDEVIAIPQAYVLCKQAEDAFWYDSTAKGKVRLMGSFPIRKDEVTVGFNVVAHIEEYGIKLAENNAIVSRWTEVRFSPGFLNFPNGSGSGSMPLLLPSEPECPARAVQWRRIDSMKKELQLSAE
ncbi:hypothetical protein [Herbaspirillum sp. BH-1]|uniref:hypothetical protein n=1 Tax=Herbaspirillum sp. (strain BH-1) TaxID=2058884 RepID=UPI000C88A9AA|nr:hypothetical protein [Herbaspirillum sp. BH-1]